jgi:hypothetical protein
VTGLLVFWLKPGTPASTGLLSATFVGGVFGVTGADLYGPHWFFRLHVLAESLVFAGLIHFILVFPVDRLRHRRHALFVVYSPSLLLAAGYEAMLFSPSAYSRWHLLASALQGLWCAGASASLPSVPSAPFSFRAC